MNLNPKAMNHLPIENVTPNRACWNSLPIELIISILEFVWEDDKKSFPWTNQILGPTKAISKLSCVNKKLLELCRPWRLRDIIYRGRIPKSHRDLNFLSDVLIHRAKYDVKLVYWTFALPPSLPIEQMETNGFLAQYFRMRESGALAIALDNWPNVKHLLLTLYPTDMCPKGVSMDNLDFENLPRQPTASSNFSGNPVGSHQTLFVLPCSNLLNITSLAIEGYVIENSAEEAYLSDLLRKMPNLTHLSIYTQYAPKAYLINGTEHINSSWKFHQILAGLTSLQHLSIQPWAYVDPSFDNTDWKPNLKSLNLAVKPTLNLDRVYRFVSKFHQTLQDLCLEFDYNDYFEELSPSYKLPHLIFLTITNLYGRELPISKFQNNFLTAFRQCQNLHTITFGGVDSLNHGFIQFLIQENFIVQTVWPKCKKIEICWFHLPDQQHLVQIHQACEKAKIELASYCFPSENVC